MAKVYLVTDEEMISLIESIELEAMRKANVIAMYQGNDPAERPKLDDMFRAFHYVVVRWVQSMGASGVRR